MRSGVAGMSTWRMPRVLSASTTAFITADEGGGFAETMQLIGSKYQVSALDRPEVARAALASYVDGYAAGQGPTGIAPQRWQATYDEVSSVGQVPAGLDPAQWLDAGLNGTEGTR